MAAFDTETKVFNFADDAARSVKDGIVDNNRSWPDATFAQWNASEAVDTYIDGDITALGEDVSRADVIALVEPWLEERTAFEAALKSAVAFADYIRHWDLDGSDISAIIGNNSGADAPAWAEGLDSDYIGLLDDGSVIAWGADRTDGRDICVLIADVTKPGSYVVHASEKVPSLKD